VIHAAPSTTELIDKMSESVLNGQYYQALKTARELIRYEQELVSNACKSA
jgi:flagellar protein FlbT